MKLKYEENTRLAMQKAGEGQEPLDKDFYKRIKEKTDQEMKKQQTEVITSTDLTEAREELEKILRKVN